MTTAQLYDLDVPDETTELDLKDCDQKTVLENVYNNWASVICGLGDNEHRYRKACQMIRPYANQLTDDVMLSQLGFLKYDWMEWGRYLSAVLNETDVKRLCIDTDIGNLHADLRAVGYRLKSGKTVEISENGHVWAAGEHAEGGTVINRGYVMYMGSDASAGTFVNYKHANNMGDYSKGGLFVNFGHNLEMGRCAEGGIFTNLNGVKTHTGMGICAKGGTYLNYGKVAELGGCAENSVFVTHKKPSDFLPHANDTALGVAGWDLFWDKPLRMLMKAAKAATKDDRFGEIEPLARQIDAHVRQNYKRRVA